MNRLAFATLVTCVLLCGCARSGEASLVDRVVEAYGGRDAIARDAVEQRGRILSPVHPGVVGTVVRRSEGGNRLRVETVFPNQPPEVRIVNGGRGWREGREVEGPNLAAMALQAARLALPKLLLEHRAEVIDQGEVERAGSKRHELALDLGGGKRLTLEVDPNTAYIVRTVGRASTVPGAPDIEFSTDYGEFRRVGARIFPFYECTTAMGQRTADITFTSMEERDAFPPAEFAP